jgi:hypothetical protein
MLILWETIWNPLSRGAGRERAALACATTCVPRVRHG